MGNRLFYDADNQKLQWRGDFTLADEERLMGLTDDPAFQRAVRAIGGSYRIEVFTQDLSQILTQAATVQNTLRSTEASLLDNIDDFKLFLGIPTDFQVTLDKSMLKPFELIDPRINRVEDRLQQSIKTWENPDGSEPTQDQLETIMRSLLRFWREIKREGMQPVAQDLAREEANRPARLKSLATELERQQVMRNVERDRILFQRNEEQHARLRLVLLELQRLNAANELPLVKPQVKIPFEAETYPNVQEYTHWDQMPSVDDVLGALRAIREDFLQIVQGLKVTEVGARSELITLQDFDMSLEDVVAIAVENRLDLMNTRAQVMDARRNLEVAANRLQGVLNVVTRGDIRNSGGTNPFDFRAEDSTFQFGLQFTAPLDQVLVRNTYRSALINYQQVRRAYMLAEDTVKRDVRLEWRRLQLNRANFETARQNIRYAAINYDVTVENAYQPSRSAASALPGVGGGVGLSQGQNTGLQLLNALNSILTAQNNLIGIWVAYEQNRINIYRDMDIMVIDERGLWSDPVYQPASDRPPSLPSEPADVIPPQPAADADRDRDVSPLAPAGADNETFDLSAFDVSREDRVGSDRPRRISRQRLSDHAGRAALSDLRVSDVVE